MSKFTVLHAPGLEEQAKDIASKLEGSVPVFCTANIMPNHSGALCWDSFPSGDPNIKLRIEAIKDKHVVYLMHHDTRTFFEQVSSAPCSCCFPRVSFGRVPFLASP